MIRVKGEKWTQGIEKYYEKWWNSRNHEDASGRGRLCKEKYSRRGRRGMEAREGIGGSLLRWGGVVS